MNVVNGIDVKIRVEGISTSKCLKHLIETLEQVDPWRLRKLAFSVEYDFIALHVLSVYFQQVLFYSSQEYKMLAKNVIESYLLDPRVIVLDNDIEKISNSLVEIYELHCYKMVDF
jgi:hypothetical protein